MTIEFASADLIEGLLNPCAYPHEVGEVQLVETHISWVFLTGDYAYKVKKPVDFGFLNFTTLAKRRHFCEEEIRLNRSWAPDLYLDVVPISLINGKPRVGDGGEPVEYSIRMRQFAYDMRLDRQLAIGALAIDDMHELAAEIARQHLQARPLEHDERLLRVTSQQIRANYGALAGRVPDAFLSAQRQWMESKLDACRPVMEARSKDGFFRECHGDLKLANIVRLPEGIRAFDCIEFNRELREIDVVADYAFLTMDLKSRGAANLAGIFLNRYLELTGDYGGACLLPVYEVYRSLVRAKILGIKLRDGRESAAMANDRRAMRRYCALARALTRPRRPLLVAMTGFSASGKSWLSERLIPELSAIRLRSDLERKRLAQLGPTARSNSGIASGIYDPTATEAVYGHLLQIADQLLRAGLNVIVDASFLSATHRRLARQAARNADAGFALIKTTASEAVLHERLQERADRESVSEADSAVLRHQLESADALTADEKGAAIIVDTENAIDIPALTASIHRYHLRVVSPGRS